MCGYTSRSGVRAHHTRCPAISIGLGVTSSSASHSELWHSHNKIRSCQVPPTSHKRRTRRPGRR
eukprot:5279616-Pyramimonas_sp.AAC.1